MALIVEDGSIVIGANTYVSSDYFQEYCEARAIESITFDDEALVESLLIKAMDFLESLRSRYGGYRVSHDQPLQFPREGLYIEGDYRPFPSDAIPSELKKGQCQAAVELVDNDMMPTVGDTPVRQETIGPLTTIYATSATDPWAGPEFPKVMAWLQPLLVGTNMPTRVYRA